MNSRAYLSFRAFWIRKSTNGVKLDGNDARHSGQLFFISITLRMQSTQKRCSQGVTVGSAMKQKQTGQLRSDLSSVSNVSRLSGIDFGFFF